MKKKILIAGGSGLIGKRIIELIDKDEYELCILTRNPQKDHNVTSYKWDLEKEFIDEKAFENIEGIINLAGAGIADKRWTKHRKKTIIESRTKGNFLIKKYLEKLNIDLPVYVSASAVGFYGHRSDEILDEESSSGPDSFLVNTTVEWEKAIHALESATQRTVVLRVGLVLSSLGGALEKLILPAKFGSIGYFGSGNYYFPWIHIDDMAQLFIDALKNKDWEGTYNAVNPIPLTGKAFATAFKKAMPGFQLIHPIPKLPLRIALGEMVDMLFCSMRVVPKRLEALNYKFKFTDAQKAIEDILKRKI